MANNPLEMKKLQQLVSLHCRGVSRKQISRQTGIARNTVRKYVLKFMESQLTLEDFKCLEDREVYELFQYQAPSKPLTQKLQNLFDFFPYMEKELKKVGVTKKLMWEEYIELYPDGFKDSAFRIRFREWLKQSEPTMRIIHKVGDKMMVDYSGKLLEYINPDTGEVIKTQVFVAILPASQYTYVEASRTQKKEDFIVSCENAMHYFGGVPSAIVPDNLRSAVSKASRYEPTINETFEDFTLHYETCPLPARVRKPKDKARVEGAVSIVYKAIYARIRKQTFFSLEELNEAILLALNSLNNRILTDRTYTRRELFEEIEKKSLRPLPERKYELKHFAKATVIRDGHVCLAEDKHYYSVPHQYIRKQVKIIYSHTEVEIYYKHQRIALHKRDTTKFGCSTLEHHLLDKHRFLLNWSPESFIEKGAFIGSEVAQLIECVLDDKQHLEQAYKVCSGILSLASKVGSQRLNNACKRALNYKQYSYQIVHNILEKGLDEFTEEETKIIHLPTHDNIRGSKYYLK
jgi:transposase